MASEQYCLRWNDHRTILVTNFERLLQSHTSVDCTLAAEGQCLRAHKVVLSACSPYFEMMLNQDKEKHPIIFLKDMKYKELQAIIEYMYRGEVVIPHDQLATLLQAAESLQIKGLGCGDKPAADSGNKGLNQQKHTVQPPSPQTSQKQQSMRHSAPASRGAHNTAPQVVDLTDERVPQRSPHVARQMQDSTKRSSPQSTARLKRVNLAPVTSERYSQNNNQNNFTVYTSQNNFTVANAIPATATAQNSPASTVSTTTLHNIQISTVAGTTVQNTPIPTVSPGKQCFSVNRQINEMGAASRQVNESVTITRGCNIGTRIVTPPTQPMESQEMRDAGKQLVINRPKPRIIATERRIYVSSAPQISPQNSSLVPASQPVDNPLPIITSVTGASDTPNVLDDSAIKITEKEAEQIPPETNEPVKTPDVQETLPPEEVSDVGDSLQRDSTELASDQTKESDAEKSLSETPSGTSSSVDPELSKPGPSRQGNAAKPGRRGRAPIERRHQCPECDKKFTQKSYLEKHLRIHDGDCFQCDVCDKTFLSRATLVKHVRTHAPKPPAASPAQHNCQLCGGTFSNAEDLEKHLTDHTLSVADGNE